ncbi:GNAT family N-acetyltransferase [Planotetraspora mira]|uniref:N-acetyltransferase n=1 Tax=Planotetraspora mira TaxID=58121 RepID=A0A8J3TQL1_9ACTN|nr:GNAT family N-acetyltransferase [Planotetraspora mira]GII31328.1 N-acetyltransferase [Planotetraspora mira]
MHFRTGTKDDAERIAVLHTESWKTAYAGIMPAAYLNGSLLEERRAMWITRLASSASEPAGEGSASLVVAVEDTALQGFVYLLLQPDGRILLDNLHVLPTRKRSGIGRQLMRHAFTWAAAHHPGKAVYLEVLRDNAPAVGFYERNGGEATREFVERFPAGFELPVVEFTWNPAAVNASAHIGTTPDLIGPLTP